MFNRIQVWALAGHSQSCPEATPLIFWLCASIGLAVCLLSLNLDGQPALGRDLGGSELLPFTDDGGNCVHWDLQSSRNIYVPFTGFVPQDNLVLEVYSSFL